jgi:hypothetical protein
LTDQSCARILLPDNSVIKYANQFRRFNSVGLPLPPLSLLQLQKIDVRVAEECAKIKHCGHCFTTNSRIKVGPRNRILQESLLTCDEISAAVNQADSGGLLTLEEAMVKARREDEMKKAALEEERNRQSKAEMEKEREAEGELKVASKEKKHGKQNVELDFSDKEENPESEEDVRNQSSHEEVRDTSNRPFAYVAPTSVLLLFRQITDLHAEAMGFNVKRTKPKDLLMRCIYVPSILARPSKATVFGDR